MNGHAWLLLSWVLVLAAALFAQVIVTRQVLTTDRPERWWALVPPLAPILAWRAGRRVAPIATLMLWIAYVVLRCCE